MKFTAELYRDAAEERLKEAFDLYKLGHYAMAHYLSGVAVECVFRAYRLRDSSEFEGRHDLYALYQQSRLVDLIPISKRREFDESLQYLLECWSNNHRYRSNDALRSFLRKIKVYLKIKRGDLAKESSRRTINAASLIVKIGAERWKRSKAN